MAHDLQQRRSRMARRAAMVLPPGTQVRGVFMGRAQARWSVGAVVALCVMGAIFVLGLLEGQVVFPGVLLILFFSYSIRPVRTVVLADQGVAALSRSVWTGRRYEVLAYESLGSINGALAGTTNKVVIGADTITLSKREVNSLARLAPQPFSPSPTTTPNPAT